MFLLIVRNYVICKKKILLIGVKYMNCLICVRVLIGRYMVLLVICINFMVIFLVVIFCLVVFF